MFVMNMFNWPNVYIPLFVVVGFLGSNNGCNDDDDDDDGGHDGDDNDDYDDGDNDDDDDDDNGDVYLRLQREVLQNRIPIHT
jgi:hypothetical protein